MRITASAKRLPKQSVAQPVPLPAPVGGWDAISPLANMPVDRAFQIDNWICRPGWIEPRLGFQNYCNGLGSSSTPVETIMAYNTLTGGRKLFGAAGTTIYDCSAGGGTVAIPTTVTTLTNARLQHVMFESGAPKQYLITVNGADSPWIYDGTTWSQPAILVGYASGSIQLVINPSPGDTITFNGTVVTFVASGATGNQVNIGGTLAITTTNLLSFLSASVDANISKATYSAPLGTTSTVLITYTTSGIVGNLYKLSTSIISAVLSGPTLTGGADVSGITPSSFINVTSYMSRLWFVPGDSTSAVFLNTVNGISGAATVFPLGQFMKKGGFLLAIATWTVDTRQNVDEYIAFISSRGEIIVYQGTDPTTANTFALTGIYQIGAPLGRRCYLRIAGDLLIITMDGVVGMSEMLSTDRAAANRISLTSIIMNQMNLAAQKYKNNYGWKLIEYPLGTLVILNIPIITNSQSMQFVMNTITGAWSRFIGLDDNGNQNLVDFGINANCWEIDAFDNIYFGDNAGNVQQWNIGSTDNDADITCVVQTAYNSFGNAAQLKRYTMLQPLITTSGIINPAIGINVDFINANSFSVLQPISNSTANWDNVNWDQFNWADQFVTTDAWESVTGLGHYVSIITRITTSSITPEPSFSPIINLNGWNILAESGAYV